MVHLLKKIKNAAENNKHQSVQNAKRPTDTLFQMSDKNEKK